MIKILTFTPAWQRHEVLAICLAGIARLREYAPDRFAITPFFVVSEKKAANMVKACGFNFVMAPNNPLGQKKNTGLKEAMEKFDFDYLLEIGSDDLVNNSYLDVMESAMKAGALQIFPNCCWFIDTQTGETATCQNRLIGLGRLISRQALELFAPEYELWEPEKNRGMDTCSTIRLWEKGVGKNVVENYGFLLLDIKTSENLNQLTGFRKLNLSAGELAGHWPEAGMITKITGKKTA